MIEMNRRVIRYKEDSKVVKVTIHNGDFIRFNYHTKDLLLNIIIYLPLDSYVVV